MRKIDFSPVLEQLVDQHSLNDVLETLRDICKSKADDFARHADGDAADMWAEAADGLAHCLRTNIPMDC